MKKHMLVIAIAAGVMSANLASAVDSSLVNALPIVDKPSAQTAPSGSTAASALAVLREKWRQWSVTVGSLLGAPTPETETASCPYCPVPPCT